MAKGKPVFTLNCKNLENHRKNRLPELVFDCEKELLDGLLLAQTENSYYNKISSDSKDLVLKFGALDQLIDALECVKYD